MASTVLQSCCLGSFLLCFVIFSETCIGRRQTVSTTMKLLVPTDFEFQNWLDNTLKGPKRSYLLSRFGRLRFYLQLKKFNASAVHSCTPQPTTDETDEGTLKYICPFHLYELELDFIFQHSGSKHYRTLRTMSAQNVSCYATIKSERGALTLELVELGGAYGRMKYGGLIVYLPALLGKSQHSEEANEETSTLQWTNETTITTDRKDYSLEYKRNKTSRNEFGGEFVASKEIDTVWPNETLVSNCSTGCNMEYDGKRTLSYEPDDEFDATDSTEFIIPKYRKKDILMPPVVVDTLNYFFRTGRPSIYYMSLKVDELQIYSAHCSVRINESSSQLLYSCEIVLSYTQVRMCWTTRATSRIFSDVCYPMHLSQVKIRAKGIRTLKNTDNIFSITSISCIPLSGPVTEMHVENNEPITIYADSLLCDAVRPHLPLYKQMYSGSP